MPATTEAPRDQAAGPTPAEARMVLERYRNDPVAFATEVLGERLWSLQRQILRGLVKPRARVAVKSCHASGKTHGLATAVLWWTYTGGTAITTAPTWTQVKELLWREVRDIRDRAPVPLGGRMPPDAPELIVGRNAHALGLSTNRGVRFQGWHAKEGSRLLIALDEAPGVHVEIYEAIEGVRAGGDVRVIAQGNPLGGGGPFFDAFGKERAEWQTFTISAFDTPNLKGVTGDELAAMGPDDPALDVSPRPYLISRRFVREKLLRWGVKHPLYQAKILGQFPDQDEASLYPLAWLEQARTNETPAGAIEPVVEAGIDVAGPGEDETALKVRIGHRVVLERSWAVPDPLGDVLAALAPYRAQLRAVKVDSNGIGYHFAKRLKEAGLPVVEVNVGSAPSDKERFVNLRAEIAWGLRERLESGDVALPGADADEETIAQLCTMRYFHDARGRVQLESKEDARRRGVKSPDRAEALILAFAQVGPPPGYLGVFAD